MATAPDPTFSPVENEPPLRWQRAVHLAPRDGLGVGRRAVLFTALAWLPVAVWAAATHRFWQPSAGESLLQHFGVHARFLVAIPLLILAEARAHATLTTIFRQFVQCGVVGPDARESYARVLSGLARLRDATLPWLLLLAVVLAWTLFDAPDPRGDPMAWARAGDGELGFGGFWVAYVARPIFLALLATWLWRLCLLVVAFARIARLDLSLVPTHPDRIGGLNFVEPLPKAFSLVTFAVSAVVASHWAHEILYHGQTVDALTRPSALFVVAWSLLLLLPLLVLAPVLLSAKARGRMAYSALVAEHGRLVNRRWIRREPVGDSALLEAPEIGPVADTEAIYRAVATMRLVPIGMRSVLPILVPLAIPMFVVVALRVPFAEVVKKLLQAIL